MSELEKSAPPQEERLEDKLLKKETVEKKHVSTESLQSAKLRVKQKTNAEKQDIYNAIEKKLEEKELDEEVKKGLQDLKADMMQGEKVYTARVNAPDKSKKFMDDAKELFTNDSKTSVGKRIGNTFNSFADWMTDNKIVNWIKDKLSFGKK